MIVFYLLKTQNEIGHPHPNNTTENEPKRALMIDGYLLWSKSTLFRTSYRDKLGEHVGKHVHHVFMVNT